VSETHSRPG